MTSQILQATAAKVPASGGMLTDLDTRHVQNTWANLYSLWEDKHGLAFFLRLMDQHPDFELFFDGFKDKNKPDEEIVYGDKCKAHVAVFGKAFDKLVVSLHDTDVLVNTLHRLSDSHVARGLSASDFERAFSCFVGYASETDKFSKDQTNAWTNINRTIIKLMTDYEATLDKPKSV